MLSPALECPECGYVFADVSAAQVGADLREVATQFETLLAEKPTEALRARPSEAVWSALEYAAHVRDVILNLRERILLALVEDHPVFAPIYREQRVSLARYNNEDPPAVGQALALGADLLGWVVEGLDERQLGRTGVYAGDDRDVLWIARQALHEARHHFADARASASTA